MKPSQNCLKSISQIGVCIVLLFFSSGLYAQRKVQQMDPEKAEKEKAAQDYEHVPFKDRLTYGGNFWLSFNSNFSQVYLQPLVGYKVNKDFIVGTGFTYIYWSQKVYYTSGKSAELSDNVFGLNFFAKHQLFGPLFAHAEYQPMNFTSYNMLGDSKRIWTNALYLGGGLNQSGAYILVLYDVVWRQYSPMDPKSFAKSFYPSPWIIRMGFMF